VNVKKKRSASEHTAQSRAIGRSYTNTPKHKTMRNPPFTTVYRGAGSEGGLGCGTCCRGEVLGDRDIASTSFMTTSAYDGVNQ